MHIHIGLLAALIGFLTINVGIGTLWRIAAYKLKDTALGQAMAFIY
jgi:hypothetical protein